MRRRLNRWAIDSEEELDLLKVDTAAAIIRTIEDFQLVYSPGSGAVLYPADLGSGTLHENLTAAAIATTLGLSSIDYARRMYTREPLAPTVAPAIESYRRASQLARDHVNEWLEALAPVPGRSVTFGTFAATVALHRATAGFSAAHILYSLGYNYEGDAVARQVLEQVAWSYAACFLDDETKIAALSATKCVSQLRRELLPYIGRLNGDLSNSAHADLDEHQAVFGRSSRGHGAVTIAWTRTSASAAHLLDLADAWVVTWEFVQFDYLQIHESLTSDKALNADRPFVKLAVAALEEVNATRA